MGGLRVLFSAAGATAWLAGTLGLGLAAGLVVGFDPVQFGAELAVAGQPTGIYCSTIDRTAQLSQVATARKTAVICDGLDFWIADFEVSPRNSKFR